MEWSVEQQIHCTIEYPIVQSSQTLPGLQNAFIKIKFIEICIRY